MTGQGMASALPAGGESLTCGDAFRSRLLVIDLDERPTSLEPKANRWGGPHLPPRSLALPRPAALHTGT